MPLASAEHFKHICSVFSVTLYIVYVFILPYACYMPFLYPIFPQTIFLCRLHIFVLVSWPTPLVLVHMSERVSYFFIIYSRALYAVFFIQFLLIICSSFICSAMIHMHAIFLFIACSLWFLLVKLLAVIFFNIFLWVKIWCVDIKIE